VKVSSCGLVVMVSRIECFDMILQKTEILDKAYCSKGCFPAKLRCC